jgi:hypothetical protein
LNHGHGRAEPLASSLKRLPGDEQESGSVSACLHPNFAAAIEKYGRTVFWFCRRSQAARRGLERILLTCEVGNEPSRRVIVATGGRFAINAPNRQAREWISQATFGL